MTAGITGCAWCVLLLALAIAQGMMMGERRGELYVWHAVGASRGIVRRVMLGETLAIYIPGSLLGVLIAGILFGFLVLPAVCIVCLSALI
jgi:putative ABC transport system permease protein